jgi:hypothetical protein
MNALTHLFGYSQLTRAIVLIYGEKQNSEKGVETYDKSRKKQHW